MNVLSLCSGIGGLEVGIGLAEPTAKPVCFVEMDPFAACVLAARMESGDLEACPIYCDDLRRFDASRWNGVVDCVAAGFPCQPFSTAGKMLHELDDRWLGDEVVRVARESGADFVFTENVRKRAFERVGIELEAMGYRVVAISLPASALGAGHIRRRCFLLAHSGRESIPLEQRRGSWKSWQREIQLAGHLGWEREPGVDRVADGIPSQMDRLRCLGNAVVPQQAALAWRVLKEALA